MEDHSHHRMPTINPCSVFDILASKFLELFPQTDMPILSLGSGTGHLVTLAFQSTQIRVGTDSAFPLSNPIFKFP